MPSFLNLTYLLLVLGAGLTTIALLRLTPSPHSLNSRHLLRSIVTILLIFGAWDIYATSHNHWSFNRHYITGWHLSILPIEEWLFFISIPAVCLALILLLRKYSLPQLPGQPLVAIWVISSLLTLIIFTDKQYTALASIVLLLSAWISLRFNLYQNPTWTWFHLITLPLFIIFNTILTALPIVEYNPLAISGIRFGTIPVEDFMFNATMLNTAWIAYFGLTRHQSRQSAKRL